MAMGRPYDAVGHHAVADENPAGASARELRLPN